VDGSLYHPKPGTCWQLLWQWQNLAISFGQYCFGHGCEVIETLVADALNNIEKINQRLNAVEWLIVHTDERKQLLTATRQCGDVERLVSKVPLKKINPGNCSKYPKACNRFPL
jgi:hypothetical protein